MPKPAEPDLKKYMDKICYVQLNGNRKLIGRLRGFDVFMNLVMEDCLEEVSVPNAQKQNTPMVVAQARKPIGTIMVRGNSVEVIEPLDQ